MDFSLCVYIDTCGISPIVKAGELTHACRWPVHTVKGQFYVGVGPGLDVLFGSSAFFSQKVRIICWFTAFCFADSSVKFSDAALVSQLG